MAKILLVEDVPDLGMYEARLLEAEGHFVMRCSGGPTPFAACPMLRIGSCPLADAADVIVFSCGLIAPMQHRSYRGIHLLNAYREHAQYGKLPMAIVAFGVPDYIAGTGPVERIDKFANPRDIIEAVDRLVALSKANRLVRTSN